MKDHSFSTELYQFLATNPQQDWDFDADGWQGIVVDYVDEVPTPACLLRLAQQIDGLRGSRPEPRPYP